mmetsp:Transcript_125327/g.250166  ORF Transcript_125327/g.250166 Transcript_125327/m.250166 type:complete len:279 (+) Transcript_125327:39-875(+)
MVELRQRRGGGDAKQAVHGGQQEIEADRSEDLLGELGQLAARLRDGPRVGVSSEAMRCREALQQDPYNLERIFELGLAYAEDSQWEQCANVLLRGWKRVGELQDLETRCQFLLTLCQASVNLGKFRQTLAVLADMEESDEPETKVRVEALRCHANCSIGDSATGLQAFHRAIAGQDFETASGCWALCYPSLQQVGALQATRNAIEDLAADDEDRKKLDLLENLARLKNDITLDMAEDGKANKFWRRSAMAMLAILGLVLCCYLYVLEKRSFQQFQVKN